MAVGPRHHPNRQATVAARDHLTDMTQPRRPCMTCWGGTATHVTHSCGFDPN